MRNLKCFLGKMNNILSEAIKSNIYNLLKVDKSHVVKIRIHEYNKRAFHSGKRPCAAVSIKYYDDCSFIKNDHIWVKKIDDPKMTFIKMQYIYNKLAQYSMSQHMPAPLHFDQKSRLIFLEQIFGFQLITEIMKHICHFPKNIPSWIKELLIDIGIWLRKFHLVMASQNKIFVSDIIEEVDSAIKSSIYFTELQKKLIQKHLNCIKNRIDSKAFIDSVTPHNDFSLRNIICDKKGNFSIIDWDAMSHADFPKNASIWHDLTNFLINIQSLIKFYPFVSIMKMEFLINSFLTGYFDKSLKSFGSNLNDILYIFTLKAFVGLSGDRPLYEVYKKRLGFRFIYILKKMLLNGKPCITKILAT